MKIIKEAVVVKDFSFTVQCNDGPAIKINVVAESFDKAKEYVKTVYAATYTTYADCRFNIWSIKEV